MFSSEITTRKIFVVISIGFASVIFLLVAGALMSFKNAQLIEESASGLVRAQMVSTRLIEEVQREQDAINAVFYHLSRGSYIVDRDRVLSQLDQTDDATRRIVLDAKGTAQESLWTELSNSMLAFSLEARRVLVESDVPGYTSRELFRLHEQVTGIVAMLIESGYRHALNSQEEIAGRADRLARQSFLLLGGSLLLALICAILTVHITGTLFRRMTLQSDELSRVTWHMLDAQETMARRFAHELHDELGQSLTAIKANLLTLKASSPDQEDRIGDSTQLIDESIRNVRELSQLLRPTILDDFGLDAGLRWLGERFQQRTGIEVDYKSEFTGRLPDQTETHLFRIVQEALTNIARHSGATVVKLVFQEEKDRVHLAISDNGKGLPAVLKRERGASGMGLIGMRARARSAGGELQVQSPNGSGVSIELWAPVQNGKNG